MVYFIISNKGIGVQKLREKIDVVFSHFSCIMLFNAHREKSLTRGIVLAPKNNVSESVQHIKTQIASVWIKFLSY